MSHWIFISYIEWLLLMSSRFWNNCAENKKKKKKCNKDFQSMSVWCLCVATRGGYTVMVVPSQKYTHEDSSSYKIQFYCQNSAHKTLQNDCKKKKNWLITVVLITGDSNHIKAQTLKECFLRKSRYKWTFILLRNKGTCLIAIFLF